MEEHIVDVKTPGPQVSKLTQYYWSAVCIFYFSKIQAASQSADSASAESQTQLEASSDTSPAQTKTVQEDPRYKRRNRPKRRQRSSLLFGGRNSFNSMPHYRFSTTMIWRKGWFEEWTPKNVPRRAATTFAFSSVCFFFYMIQGRVQRVTGLFGTSFYILNTEVPGSRIE